MEYEVRVGDYVRCISDKNCEGYLTVGNHYQVIDVDLSGYNRFHMYYVNDNSGSNYGYYLYRFEYDLIYNRKKKLEVLKSLV